MINKGIDLEAVFCAEIFEYDFEADEWPSSHPNDEMAIKHYNAALFNLRKHYDNVFDEYPEVFGKAAKNSMMYKISYRVNLLGTIQADGETSFMEILAEQSDTEQMGIFNATCLEHYIEYKWDTYAKYLHYFGFMIHIVYMISLALFIHSTYMSE